MPVGRSEAELAAIADGSDSKIAEVMKKMAESEVSILSFPMTVLFSIPSSMTSSLPNPILHATQQLHVLFREVLEESLRKELQDLQASNATQASMLADHERNAIDGELLSPNRERLVEVHNAVSAPSPVVLQGLVEMKRKGLGRLVGFKMMTATLYTSGQFILSKAKSPEIHKARINITDTQRSSYSTIAGAQPSFMVRSKPQKGDAWEEYVLRQPNGILAAPSVVDWMHAFKRARLTAHTMQLAQLKVAANAIFEKAWQGCDDNRPAEEFKVVFEQEGPLGIFITDTTLGEVVINGPKENGFELLPEGTAAKLGLKKGDGILSVNGQPAVGMDSNEVKALAGSAGRPLEMMMQRHMSKEEMTEMGALTKKELKAHLEGDRTLREVLGIPERGWQALCEEMGKEEGAMLSEEEFAHVYTAKVGGSYEIGGEEATAGAEGAAKDKEAAEMLESPEHTPKRKHKRSASLANAMGPAEASDPSQLENPVVAKLMVEIQEKNMALIEKENTLMEWEAKHSAKILEHVSEKAALNRQLQVEEEKLSNAWKDLREVKEAMKAEKETLEEELKARDEQIVTLEDKLELAHSLVEKR